MIRNTAEYRTRDLSNSELVLRRQHHVRGLQRRFPFLGEQDISYTWTGTAMSSRSRQVLIVPV